MKRLAILFSILVWGVFAFGQSTPATVATDGYLSDPAHQYIWGSASDTLTNADTLNYVWRVRGRQVYDINIKLYSDFVSGSAGGTLKAYSSIDGVNYAVLDTFITVSSLTADGMDAETIVIPDFCYPYLKLIYLQSGTAVTVPKVYLYAKEN